MFYFFIVFKKITFKMKILESLEDVSFHACNSLAPLRVKWANIQVQWQWQVPESIDELCCSIVVPLQVMSLAKAKFYMDHRY